MHRTAGRAAKLAAQSGREQLGQWQSAAAELGDSRNGGGRTGASGLRWEGECEMII